MAKKTKKSKTRKANKYTSLPMLVKKDRVTIPKFIRKKLKIKDGDRIKFKIISDTEVKLWKK